MRRLGREDTILTKLDNNVLFGPATAVCGDYTLPALLRAITIRYSGTSLAEKDEIVCPNVVVRSATPASDPFGNAEAHSSRGDIIIYDSLNAEWFKTCTELSHSDPWRTFDSAPFLNKYISQFANTKIFANEESAQIIVFVESRINLLWIRVFASIMFLIMTWYFPDPLRLPVLEKNLGKALSVDNKTDRELDLGIEALIEYVNSSIDSKDIRGAIIHRQLNGIASSVVRGKISEYRSRVENAKTRMADFMAKIRDLCSTIDEGESMLKALHISENDGDEKYIEFFKEHENTTILSVSDTDITYRVDDTLSFYDKDELETDLLDNDQSWLYDDYDYDTIEALNSLLVEGRGLIKVNAEFCLSNLRLVNPHGHIDNVPDSMPNPHIYFYTCSGENEKYYAQFADSGDWELAVEQSISATKNLRVSDTTVFSDMINWLLNTGRKCIYVNDDFSPVDKVVPEMSMVSFREFISKMKESKNGGGSDE